MSEDDNMQTYEELLEENRALKAQVAPGALRRTNVGR